MIKHKGNRFDQKALQDFVDIRFGIEGAYAFNKQPSKLSISIQNKSSTATILIDWEKGALQNFQGGDRRLIRLVDRMREVDKSKAQTPSSITPRRSLSVTLTAEDLLRLDPKTNFLLDAKPIVDIEQLAKDKDAKPKDRKDEERIEKLRNIYDNFMTQRKPLRFSLKLPLQITDIVEGSPKNIRGFVECNFSVSLDRAAQSQPKSSNPSPEQRRKLERELARFQEQCDSLTRQLQHLQRDYANEKNAANRLRLQKQIEAFDLELEQLQADLEKVSQQLS